MTVNLMSFSFRRDFTLTELLQMRVQIPNLGRKLTFSTCGLSKR